METLRLIEKCDFIKDYDILEYYTIGSDSYIKIKAILKDNSELYIREYFTENSIDYSYHWQTSNGMNPLKS
jgi:hypothetical protein